MNETHPVLEEPGNDICKRDSGIKRRVTRATVQTIRTGGNKGEVKGAKKEEVEKKRSKKKEQGF